MHALIALLVFILSLGVTHFAFADTQGSEKQSVQYDVYAGGIHALQANLDIAKQDKRYETSLSAKTYGLLGKLAPWHGTFRSKGWAGKPHKVEEHQSITTWKKEEETKTYRYKKDGSFGEYRIQDDKHDGSIKEVDTELTDQTTDILTSTLNTMEHIGKGEDCEGTSEIFDGKRRFKMIFKQKKETMLEPTKYNVYSGPAIECTVEVQPVAGKWYKKPRGWLSIQEQGRERGTMPTVWFASVSEGKPAIPVKVRVKTAYGTLFMHMTEYEDGSKSLALKK